MCIQIYVHMKDMNVQMIRATASFLEHFISLSSNLYVDSLKTPASSPDNVTLYSLIWRRYVN